MNSNTAMKAMTHPLKHLVADHVDENKLNNHSSNLRYITQRENVLKSFRSRGKLSAFVGASLHKTTGLWRSRIYIKNKEIPLGYFKTELEAHKRYQQELNKLNNKEKR